MRKTPPSTPPQQRPGGLPLLLCLAAALHGAPALAAELSGTAFSIVYRGPALAPTDPRGQPGGRTALPANTPYNPYRPPLRVAPSMQPQPQSQVPVGAVGVLRLADARTGAEVARATFDQRLDGWLFQLPMNPALAGSGGCLTLRSAAGGMLPLRDASGGDDGLSFANPLWAAEIGRMAEQGELRREREQVEARQAQARAELKQVQDSQPPAGGVCTAPPQPPDPPRPPAAIDAAEARAAAPGICAARWQQVLGAHADLGRLFQDAGLGADWSAREAGGGAAEAFRQALPLRATRDELLLVIDAARKGKVFLEHASGVQLLQRVQTACRADVPALAVAATSAWEAAVQQARQTPARLLRECQLGQQRIAQLQQQIAAGETYRAELDRRSAAQAGTQASTQTISLAQSRCQ